MKQFFSLTGLAMEIRKEEFPSYDGNGCYEEEKLCQKLEFYRFKLSLQKLD